MTDRIVSVGDDLTIPAGVIVPVDRVDGLGTAAIADADDFATSSQGAKADAADTALAGRLSESSLSSTYVSQAERYPVLNPLTTAKRGAAPRILTLAVGGDDETAQGSMSNGTIVADTVNYKYGGRGWKLTNTASAAYMKWTINNPAPGVTKPLPTGPWQAVCAWVYIPDATKITAIQFTFYGSADLSTTYRWIWSSNTAPLTPLVTGWNFIRVPASFSGVNPTGNIYQAEFFVSVNADTNVTIGHWYFECPAKAKFILTADRGYETFYQNIYPQLVARKWPITIGIDCTLLGTGTGIGQAMTLAEVKACAAENGNSISFHGWDGAPTSAMTQAQLRADTLKAIKFLQREFPNSMGRFWRSAYVQGLAAEWVAMKDYLLAAAAAQTDTIGPIAWPPTDWYKIRRLSLDNYKTLQNITDWFTQAQATHLTYNVFVHGYDGTVPGYDVDSTRWNLFRDSLDAAIAAGWAEVGTFEQFYLESGGTFHTAGGATVAEYTDASGAKVIKQLL